MLCKITLVPHHNYVESPLEIPQVHYCDQIGPNDGYRYTFQVGCLREVGSNGEIGY